MSCCSLSFGSVDQLLLDGGGGGGGTPALDVTIISDVTDGVTIIGKVHDFAFIADGVAPYSYVWEVFCQDADGELLYGIGSEEPTSFAYCFVREGVIVVRVSVQDSVGAEGEDSVEITVNGPNNFDPDTDEISEPAGDGPAIVSVLHKWYARVDEELVGECWDNACVYEFAAVPIDTTGDGNADSWSEFPPEDVSEWDSREHGFQWCPNDPKERYFWHSPFINDKKSRGMHQNWEDVPVGHVFQIYLQWVAIKVPQCCDDGSGNCHRYAKAGPFLFHVIHVGDGKIKHELQDTGE